jgi:hypothetical protein
MDNAAYWETDRMPSCVFQGPADDGTIGKSLPLSTIELIPWRMAARDIEKSFVLTLLRIAHVAHVS